MIRIFLMVLAGACVVTQAHAGRLAAQLHGGADRGAAQWGFDLDYKVADRQSLGTYFLMAFEDEKANRQGFWSMGADFKIYFGPKSWRLYLAPGLGFTSFDLGQQRQETALGAMLKVGALHRLSQSLFVGLDYSQFHNWFTREVPEGFDMLNFSLRYEF